MSTILQKIGTKYKGFFQGNERTVKAKKHIIGSFAVKAISIIVSFVMVPLVLGYLDSERYGIWLTLSSIIHWFAFFDIGLGGGLRNRLAEAIALKDYHLARVYVTTTYVILGVIFLAVLVIFWVVNPFLNWQKILNSEIINNKELTNISYIVFTFFILNFYFKLIGIILLAHQRPAINNLFGPLGNILSLIIIYILTRTTEGSLLYLSIVLSVVPAIVLVFANLYFFNGQYKHLTPSLKYFELKKVKDITSLGFKFFYFQIGRIIFFTTTNFLIAQFASQRHVAQYNVGYKYFFTAMMIYTIILTPFWSAVTDAYVKKDFAWLKKAIQKLNILSVIMVLCLGLMLLVSPFVYDLWVGNKIDVPFNLSLIIAIYIALQIIVAPFSQFINGFGKLKLGLITITIKLLIYLPAAYFLGQKYGAVGIVASMALIQLPSIFIEGIQTYKIINQKAKGIWAQ